MLNNEFISKFIEKSISVQLTKLLKPDTPKIPTVDKAIVYFTMEYAGPMSFGIRNRLCQLMKVHYPQLSIRVIFKASKTIQNYFRIKDIVTSDLKSSIVYKYQCGGCNSTYVGKTLRHLRARRSEHLGRSFRTGERLSKPPFSAIRDHSVEQDHQILLENFSVLSSHYSDMELRIAECLHTIKVKPNIGNNESSIELVCF